MRRAGIVLAAAAVYLLVALVAWWHVWSGGPAHTLTASGWGDPAQQVWFLAWVPHAIASGIDPFVSHAIFAPGGINLMVNSSILLPALVASPATVAFGPVVAFNVMVVAAPAASALTGYLVFGRYTSFGFGAFLAGLFYGFSPFVLNDLADGHLHMTLLVFPPLVLALLDDLTVSQRGSALSRGALLGAVLAAQALTSLEVLLIVVLIGAAGVAILALRHPREIGPRWRRVAAGLGVSFATSSLLLAWPAYILVLGPRRYHGSVFTSPESYVAWFKALVWPRGGTPIHPFVWSSYIGIPLLVLIALGAWRAKRHAGILRLCVALGMVALIFAMGRSIHLTPAVGTGIPLPDTLIAKLPLVRNLLPVRFMIAVDLLVALGLAVTLGAMRDGIRSKLAARSARHAGLASVAAGCAGVLALASPALSAQWPYPTRQVTVPAVYRSAAVRSLPKGSILLAYPVMNGFQADPMIWQATEQLPYDMVAGYGFIPAHGPHPLGSLPSSPVTNLFGDAEVGLLPGPSLAAAQMRLVRRQLGAWRVSDIVVLDEGRQPRELVAILTKLLGRSPRRVDGAWVWLKLRPPALKGS
ncbi:MAG: glycosyltransferase family protein [Acidimicrobiales bacterium]